VAEGSGAFPYECSLYDTKGADELWRGRQPGHHRTLPEGLGFFPLAVSPARGKKPFALCPLRLCGERSSYVSPVV